MHYVLVCRPNTDDVYETPENEGYDYRQIVGLLGSLSEDSHEVLDTTELSDGQRHMLYIDRAVTAAGNRYRVGRIFGSNKYPGLDFGWRVPALLVYTDRDDPYPADVYPHEHKDGRIVTIAEHLDRP